MSERFLKFIPSEEAFWLIENRPNAFRLLTHIANTARRTPGSPDGLSIGQCHLQHWKKYKLTEQQYRTAKLILVQRNHIKIIETNRTRQKSTTGSTTKSTLVELISTTVYDINAESINDRINDRATTDQRLTNDKQERKKDKNEKESHPSIPSKNEGRLTDDFSLSEKTEEMAERKNEVYPGIFMTDEEMAACVKIKGDLERVKQAVEFIMNSPKRKTEIADWPNALMQWKVEKRGKAQIRENITYTEKLCREFSEFDHGYGWRCYMHNDQKRDQRGILFESQSPYQPAFFVALAEGELQEKCERFIQEKHMRKDNEK